VAGGGHSAKTSWKNNMATDTTTRPIERRSLSSGTNTPQSFVVSVRYIPLLNLVWVGVALMCLGIVYPSFKTRPRAA